MVQFILLLLLFPFIFGNVYEFGLKLKAPLGNRDDLLLGIVELIKNDDVVSFKELIDQCVQDYLFNEVRQPTNHLLEGIIARDEYQNGTEFNYEVIGEALTFQNYLSTMMEVFYRGEDLMISFYDRPIIKTSCKNNYKCNAYISLEYECPFLDEYNHNFLKFEMANRTDEDDSINLIEQPLISPNRVISESPITCGCCTIS